MKVTTVIGSEQRGCSTERGSDCFFDIDFEAQYHAYRLKAMRKEQPYSLTLSFDGAKVSNGVKQ